MFFKYDLPVMEWNKEELLVWSQFKGDINDIKNFVDTLTKLKSSGILLSDKSLDVLSQPSIEKKLELINIIRTVN